MANGWEGSAGQEAGKEPEPAAPPRHQVGTPEPPVRYRLSDAPDETPAAAPAAERAGALVSTPLPLKPRHLLMGLTVGAITGSLLMYGMQSTMTGLWQLGVGAEADALVRFRGLRLAGLGLLAAALGLAGVVWKLGGPARRIAVASLGTGAALVGLAAIDLGALIDAAKAGQVGNDGHHGMWWLFFYGTQLVPFWLGLFGGGLLAVRGLRAHYGTLRLKRWDSDLFVGTAALLVVAGVWGGVVLFVLAIVVTV